MTKPKLFLFAAITVVLLYTCNDIPFFSKVYDNIQALEHAYNDYLVIGKFGNNWPAKKVKESKSNNEISFVLSTGAPHSYHGYDGYELIAVFLKTKNGKETVVVLRSKVQRQ
ncbi:hypothetical protein [Candidatus Magnetominusculus xianensis]|uniref:Secreted protein n=1 Tax=Candidatus Magnetominusculus xianensis TaxID=1748249 RepID=A0ABR5SJR9_9BACT|nr:hypothetical protein [Candidatus Magnetominusculus xianensis]KWT92782.1 hypothetical protein ASN18_0487 [Candidatus Magnetominusculus xianensis]MBF0405236.1 hypothetical protein [Nitrospirota bacterium]